MTKTEGKIDCLPGNLGKRGSSPGRLTGRAGAGPGGMRLPRCRRCWSTDRATRGSCEKRGSNSSRRTAPARFAVVERLEGDATTDFGAPGAIPACDERSGRRRRARASRYASCRPAGRRWTRPRARQRGRSSARDRGAAAATWRGSSGTGGSGGRLPGDARLEGQTRGRGDAAGPARYPGGAGSVCPRASCRRRVRAEEALAAAVFRPARRLAHPGSRLGDRGPALISNQRTNHRAHRDRT